MNNSKKEAKVRSTMELTKAASYLEDIAKSLRAGRINISDGKDQSVSLTPKSTVKVEFAANQKPEKESLSLKLSWRNEEAVAQDPPIRIGS